MASRCRKSKESTVRHVDMTSRHTQSDQGREDWDVEVSMRTTE